MSAGGDEYEVGYGKPPKKNRFKKGQSGNRNGRPKGSRNFSTVFDEILETPMTVTENGQLKKVSALEAMFLRLREKALKGEQRALERILNMAEQRFAEKEGQSAERALTGAEEDILARFEQNLLAQAGVETTAADLDRVHDDE